MQHRGTARRRVLIVAGDTLPAPGTEIAVNGRSIGTLGSTAGDKGLAILRIDRVKDALDAGAPIEAGGAPVTVAIPAWATFTYPQQVSSEDA
jgi:folate-binding Fe-S cluster repair protein YgfZ